MKISTKSDLRDTDNAKTIFKEILKLRGYDSKIKIDNFINPKYPTLKLLINGLGLDKKTLSIIKKRIDSAINSKQKICIYGDYDTDGVTATAILYRTLVSMGAIVLPFIPHRKKHGYGMSIASLEEIVSGDAFEDTSLHPFTPDLIITVDNGIVSHNEAKFISENGIDLIITDHHKSEDSLPIAHSILHSTVSTASVLSWTLSKFLREDQETDNLIDLATVGLIADQLPLTGINRNIAKHGLIKLTSTSNPGLESLKKVANLEDKEITSYDVGYLISPRINAAGRLDSALTALRLLCTNNSNVASSLAEQLNEINARRQDLTTEALDSLTTGTTSDKIIFAVSDAYHEGIIGLIAGKILEESGLPAIAISKEADIAKGSARAPKGIDITKILRKSRSLTVSLGGHAQAAGFSIKPENINTFIEEVTANANEIDDALLVKSMTIDASLMLSQTTLELATLLKTLEPYGIGNPKPRFFSDNLQVVESSRVGKDNRHLRFTLEQNDYTRKSIWFNAPLDFGENLRLLNIAYTLDINHWKNKNYLNIIIYYAEKITQKED